MNFPVNVPTELWQQVIDYTAIYPHLSTDEAIAKLLETGLKAADKHEVGAIAIPPALFEELMKAAWWQARGFTDPVTVEEAKRIMVWAKEFLPEEATA